LVPGIDGAGRLPNGQRGYFFAASDVAGTMAEKALADTRLTVFLPEVVSASTIAAGMLLGGARGVPGGGVVARSSPARVGMRPCRRPHGGLVSPSHRVLRRITSIALTVAFVAMATSGLLMLTRLEFQLRLHTVHNMFGIAMVAAGILHVACNWRALAGHLRARWAMLSCLLLAGMMVLLFVLALTRPVDREVVQRIEDILTAAQAHGHLD
jgi:hypothetical protein